MYSEIIREYFENPINLGEIKNADGIGVTENEVCSDIIKIYIKVDKEDIIEDVKFQAKGCPPVIASCCEITKLIKNMKISDAEKVTAKDIIKNLGGLPKEKEHCARLVKKTIDKAILNIVDKDKIINE